MIFESAVARRSLAWMELSGTQSAASRLVGRFFWGAQNNRVPGMNLQETPPPPPPDYPRPAAAPDVPCPAGRRRSMGCEGIRRKGLDSTLPSLGARRPPRAWVKITKRRNVARRTVIGPAPWVPGEGRRSSGSSRPARGPVHDAAGHAALQKNGRRVGHRVFTASAAELEPRCRSCLACALERGSALAVRSQLRSKRRRPRCAPRGSCVFRRARSSRRARDRVQRVDDAGVLRPPFPTRAWRERQGGPPEVVRRGRS